MFGSRSLNEVIVGAHSINSTLTREPVARLLHDLSRVPEARYWAEGVVAYFGFCALALIVSPDLISLERKAPAEELILIALVALVIPAFAEEVVFRGLLLPRFDFF